jgi:U3 small nucleolar RNA-associated protein 23
MKLKRHKKVKKVSEDGRGEMTGTKRDSSGLEHSGVSIPQGASEDSTQLEMHDCMLSQILHSYQITHHIVAPFKVCVDGEFLQAALTGQILLKEQIPKLLMEERTNVFVTPCVDNWLLKKGGTYSGALHIARSLQHLKCRHEKGFLRPFHCIRALVANGNPDRLLIGAQDESTRRLIRHVAGVPLLFIHGSTIVMESPTVTTKEAHAEDITAQAAVIAEEEKRRVAEAKKAEKAEVTGASATKPTPSSKKKKPKGPKQPNPLSVKKKKVAPATPTGSEKKSASPAAASSSPAAPSASSSKPKHKKQKTESGFVDAAASTAGVQEAPSVAAQAPATSAAPSTAAAAASRPTASINAPAAAASSSASGADSNATAKTKRKRARSHKKKSADGASSTGDAGPGAAMDAED